MFIIGITVHYKRNMYTEFRQISVAIVNAECQTSRSSDFMHSRTTAIRLVTRDMSRGWTASGPGLENRLSQKGRISPRLNSEFKILNTKVRTQVRPKCAF